MFDDLLVIKTCLSKMKHARIEFCYEIRRNNEEKMIAEGFTLLACLDINRRPIAIPERIRTTLT